MPVSERTYEQVALEDPERQWELHRGMPREKQAMSFGHNHVLRRLGRLLYLQLDPNQFDVSVDASRVRLGGATYYVPDLFVLPIELTEPYRDRPEALEVYSRPLPLAVEVWSPSTGEYDVDAKLPEYQARGDVEVWRVHPFERTLAARRRQPDGAYERLVYQGGVIQPVALPGVTIDLEALFS